MTDGMQIVEAELARLEAELFAAVPVRRDAIVRLLDTRYDHLPTPIRRTEASTGFAHRSPAVETCPDCLANGRTMFGCETCGGRGYTEKKRERDPYANDKVMPYGLDGARHEAVRARDREIEILDQQLRPASKIDELADANAHPYAWERARARMYKEYDYGALDRALEQLHLARAGANPYSAASLLFIDGRMPETIRVPAASEPPVNMSARGRHADKGAMSQRDAEIRRLAKQTPISELEARFGLKKSALYEIINKEAA